MIPQVTQDYLDSGALKGNRNDSLMRAACQLRDDGWSLDQATQTLLPRARADGLSEAEIRATLRSVFKRPPREPCGVGQNHFSMYDPGAPREKTVTYYKTPVQPESLPPPIDDGAIKFLESKFNPGEFVSIGEIYSTFLVTSL
jgi:hypothetical protein